MPDTFNFKFKVQRDGKRAYLFRDASQRVSICWSEKEGVFKTTYSSRAFQQELEKDPAFCSFLQDQIILILAYKELADELEKIRQAFICLMNK